MNQQQRNYIRDRVKTIKAEKKRLIQFKFEVKTTTNEEIMAGIEAGKYKLKLPDNKKRCSCNWYGLPDLRSCLWPRVDSGLDKRQEAAKKKIDRAIDNLNAEARRITDEAMIGDGQKALFLLRNFEDMSV